MQNGKQSYSISKTYKQKQEMTKGSPKKRQFRKVRQKTINLMNSQTFEIRQNGKCTTKGSRHKSDTQNKIESQQKRNGIKGPEKGTQIEK